MRVVIAGDNEVGVHIAELLMGPHDVVLVQSSADSLPNVARLDIQTVRGFPTSPQVLEEAGVAGAKSFIACTANDEVNIVSCLVAKRLGVGRTVCVLYRPGLTDLGGEADLAASLGVDVVVHPGLELATEIIRIGRQVPPRWRHAWR